jgi:TMEM199 family protein
MVLLSVTPLSLDAIKKYCDLSPNLKEDEKEWLEKLSGLAPGDPIDHNDLIKISHFLVDIEKEADNDALVKRWRMEKLLKGAVVYRPPPPPKPEPV